PRRCGCAADFRGADDRHVSPPIDIVRDVLALGAWPSLPPLEGLVEVPVLRPDGSVLTTPGYDPATRLVYKPIAGLTVPTIPEAPTPAEIDAALHLLFDDLLFDFPFADEASVANTVGLLLTPILRPTFSGPAP